MQDTISGSSIYVTAVTQSAWGGFTYRRERSRWKQTATPTNDDDRNRRGVVDATDSDTCSSGRSSARNGSVPIEAPESARRRRTAHAGRPVDPIGPSSFWNRFLGGRADGTHALWSARYRSMIGSTRMESALSTSFVRPPRRASFETNTVWSIRGPGLETIPVLTPRWRSTVTTYDPSTVVQHRMEFSGPVEVSVVNYRMF